MVALVFMQEELPLAIFLGMLEWGYFFARLDGQLLVILGLLVVGLPCPFSNGFLLVENEFILA